MTRHLGDRLTALIDGELDQGTRDRILGHLAQCDECRGEADAGRQLKARLAGLGEPPVPVELLLGLLSLDPNRNGAVFGTSGASSARGPGGFGPGGPGALGPAPFQFQTVPMRPPAGPAAGRPSSSAGGRANVRPQRLRVAAIGAFSLAAIGTGAWLVGDLASSPATAHPPSAPAQIAHPMPGK